MKRRRRKELERVMGEQYHRSPNPLRRLVTLLPLHAALFTAQHAHTHTHRLSFSLSLSLSRSPLLDRSFPRCRCRTGPIEPLSCSAVFSLSLNRVDAGFRCPLSLMRASRPPSQRGVWSHSLSLSHILSSSSGVLSLFRRLLSFIYRLSDAICCRKAFSADELQNHQLAR